MVFKEEYTFAEVGEYVRWAVDDTDDEDRKFELNVFHAQLMVLGGYKTAATSEIEYLEKYATTDARKYILYTAATFIYYYADNSSLAAEYHEKADALDVPENHGDWVGGTPEGEEEGDLSDWADSEYYDYETGDVL